ncbi:spotted leaf 11 [Musa troglodytarum]|uniref:RING-type E3 ubiquitin transferase n=1 Tax=Musa troglodytarum TaxID=320322 RepID=A0A9E7I9Z5_9LILI|nr:spotted leaf 11 [Musa troglodytarum]
MEAESPSSYRYMGRSYSDSGDSSGPFSDCNSDQSGEFPSSGSPTLSTSSSGGGLHRLLISCAADYSDEVVRGLISEIESPSVTVESQRRAAMELRLLAKHSSENRLRIAAAGAVGPLVALLSHPDLQLQEHGVTAILNLSLCDENKSPIAAAGAIRPLIRILRTGTPAARENAACALLRLAQLDDLRAAIGRSGAIPPLVALLEFGGPRGKKDAATALFTLLASRENKARAVEAGIVRPLLDLMADPESGMVDKAAYVLHAVVEVAEGRAAAVEEDGIPVLVELVERGTPRQKETAVRSLLEICKDSAVYRKMVAHEGAIPPLVDLSQSGTKKAKEKAESLIELLRQPRAAGNSHR